MSGFDTPWLVGSGSASPKITRFLNRDKGFLLLRSLMLLGSAVCTTGEVDAAIA